MPNLPPGQRRDESFPRFGARAAPVPRVPDELRLRISGAVEEPGEIAIGELRSLPRLEQVSDLHCVTTWSKQGLHWGGWRLAEVYERVIGPRFRPRPEARWLVAFGLDGYCCSLLLEDALADDVLIADTLDGEPLSPIHGAPLRLVTPQQYAYKNLKHLCGFALREEPVRLPLGLEHPRGRVAREERHARLPAWLVRLPYRALIGAVAYLQRLGLACGHFVGRPTLLDGVIPEADHRELHHLWLDAAPADAWRALVAVTGREIRLLGPLMALRALPARLTGRTISGNREAPIFETLVENGFVRLAEERGREIVFGVVGRFWRPIGNAPLDSVRDREGFLAFDEPGYARAAMGFLVRPEGTGSRLITETRISTTDPAAARRFRRYWRLIRPGSGLIRRSWLAAVRRRQARRGAPPADPRRSRVSADSAV